MTDTLLQKHKSKMHTKEKLYSKKYKYIPWFNTGKEDSGE